MSTGTKSSTVVSSPWASRSNADSVASIRLWVRMTSAITSLRCSSGKVEGGQHLEIGTHRGQRRAQFVGGHGREIPCGLQRGLGALLFVADAGEHSLDRLGDLDGFLHPANLHLVGVGLRVDHPGLLGQHAERVDHDQPQHRGDDDGADDDPATDQQHASVQFVDPPLGFGQRSADGDRGLTGGEGADPVFHAVDRRADVTVVELRQDDVLRHRNGEAVDARGTHQTATVRATVGRARASGVAQQ